MLLSKYSVWSQMVTSGKKKCFVFEKYQLAEK